MTVITEQLTDEIAELLKHDQIGILRTDTLYGMVGSATSQVAVEAIYRLKGRTHTKPLIILIADVDQMLEPLDETVLAQVRPYWPGKVSVVVPVRTLPEWLHRGTNSIAYRMPADEELRTFLRKTGPLVAPSANPEGDPPAMDILTARNYFSDKVAFYINGGTVTDHTPSQLLRVLESGEMERLR
jgi:L-threonylcarbamoyladenylate synthase